MSYALISMSSSGKPDCISAASGLSLKSTTSAGHVHESDTLTDVGYVARRSATACGGVASFVRANATFDKSDTFPALSIARTAN